MKTRIEYTLFSRPIRRRTFYWLLFLCPLAALVVYLASRCEVDAAAPHGSNPSAPIA